MATLYPKIHTHPSAILKDILFDDYGLTVEQAAKMLDVPFKRLSNFLKGKTKVSLDLARRLDLAGINNAQFWLSFQANYDMVKHINAENKKPKIAVAAFEKIRKELDERVKKEIEAEKEIDELLMRKIEQKAEKANKNGNSNGNGNANASKNEKFNDDKIEFDDFDEIPNGVKVGRIHKHTPTPAHI